MANLATQKWVKFSSSVKPKFHESHPDKGRRSRNTKLQLQYSTTFASIFWRWICTKPVKHRRDKVWDVKVRHAQTQIRKFQGRKCPVPNFRKSQSLSVIFVQKWTFYERIILFQSRGLQPIRVSLLVRKHRSIAVVDARHLGYRHFKHLGFVRVF